MVSYLISLRYCNIQCKVLILIVVEDGLVHGFTIGETIHLTGVLILIVVEDGLVQLNQAVFGWLQVVLILIVVEDGLVPIHPTGEVDIVDVS